MKLISKSREHFGPEFILKAGKMRKGESFVTYPIHNSVLPLQSEHRWIELNLETGEMLISARREQYPTYIWLQVCRIRGTHEKDKATPEQVKEILSIMKPQV